jgi:hypothetical protein
MTSPPWSGRANSCPLQYFNDDVFLVAESTFARFQEMTEGLGTWHSGPGKPPQVGYQRLRDCTNPHAGSSQAEPASR